MPDIAILAHNRMPADENREITSRGIDIDFAPDWVIEIVFPNQSQTHVTGNMLHCLQHGAQAGWLLDPDEKSVLCYARSLAPTISAR